MYLIAIIYVYLFRGGLFIQLTIKAKNQFQFPMNISLTTIRIRHNTDDTPYICQYYYNIQYTHELVSYI